MAYGNETSLPPAAGSGIAYMKHSEAAGTVYESHVIYAIRTFWIGCALLTLGIPLTFVGVGVIILGLGVVCI